MKKALFHLSYLLTVALPSALYLQATGIEPDTYTVSVALGVAAFILICDQFILASRPSFAVRALGAKGLLALHRTTPAAILAIAAAHFTLKFMNGFGATSVKAGLGMAAFVILTLLSAFAAVIMANTVLSRMDFPASFRKWFNARTGMTYKKARDLHNAFVLPLALVLVHALMASSSNLAANPAGASLIVLWAFLSLGIYARYRIGHRGGSERGNPASTQTAETRSPDRRPIGGETK